MNKLSKQDLIDLSWEKINSLDWEYKGEFGNLGYWTKVILREWKDNSFIKGIRGSEEKYLYQGKLGDKEYFTKLMYGINLHNQE